MTEDIYEANEEVKVTKTGSRKWSGEPTEDGNFRCYSSSIETKEEATETVAMLCEQGMEAWFEYNKKTRKYVVKFAK